MGRWRQAKRKREMVIPILAAPLGLHRMGIRGNTHFNILSQQQQQQQQQEQMQNKRRISFVNPVQPLSEIDGCVCVYILVA